MKKKLNLSGAFAFVLAILILLIFVPINMIFSYFDKVYDITPSGKYTLDPVTVEILDQCSDKDIDVYFLNSLFNLKSEPRALPLYHTLIELEKRDNITLTCFNPNVDTELANSLNPNGLFTVNVNDIFVKCDDVIKQVPYTRFFQTDSQGIMEYAGENLITGAISLCASGSLPTVYFLTGYGYDPQDMTLDDGSVISDDCYSLYKDEIRIDNYAVENLDLSTVDKVPSNTAIIYLTAPQRDISVSDREKLSEYIDNGGAVSMFLSPCETKGRFENIDYLLAKFELEMDYNIVSEKNTSYQLYNLESEKDEKYFRITYPAKSEDYSEDLTTDINSLITNNFFTIDNMGISNTRSFRELTSSGEMTEKAVIIGNLPTAMDSEEYTTVSTPMGGDDKTAAAAGKRSQQPLAFGYYSYNKQSGAKLIVLGSDELLTDEKTTNSVKCSRMLTKFSNTWLYDSDVNIGIENKFNSYDTMTFEDGKAASSAIKLFIIVPILFGLAGAAVWLKRRYA